jgi:hypothetical protein
VSDDKPSIDPVTTLLERGVRSPLDQSVAASLVGLVYLARQTLEERRRKQCLEVTDAILKIDPEHAEARTIQASVRSEMEREFASAQLLAQDACSKNDPLLYGQAEAALRRIVDSDPDNLEAKTLLLKTVSSRYFSPSSDTAHTTHTTLSGRPSRHPSILVGSAAVVFLVAVLALSKGIDSQVSAELPPAPGDSANAGSLAQRDRLVEPVIPGDQHTVAVSLKPARIEATSALPSPVPPLRASVPALPGSVAASAMGTLAVSAAVPVDIYRGEEHLGSTPTTLHLPLGSQTLEYRYEGLRQTRSHVIKSQETATAAISFLIKVEINAKPWAQVSVEGTQLEPLGQTPLGAISVPIGSVLVFQNPGFPDKRYRVTARDTTIQMTFP